MYRPNFSQAFQRAGPTTVPPTLSAGLYPTQSFTSSLLSNGTLQSNIVLLVLYVDFVALLHSFAIYIHIKIHNIEASFSSD